MYNTSDYWDILYSQFNLLSKKSKNRIKWNFDSEAGKLSNIHRWNAYSEAYIRFKEE